MPPNKSIPGSPQDWLDRAKGNLALAKTKKPAEAFWEDLCFDAQQAAEKALKAVLLYHGIEFAYVHDLEVLLTTLDENGVDTPEAVRESALLTEYAVDARYPGGKEPVTEQEYHTAVHIAEEVVLWADSIINATK